MKWWEWVFSGIGVLGLGLLIEWLRRRSRSSEQRATITAQGAKVTHSPVASGSGITQTISETHHHHYPPPPAAAPAAPEPESERPKHNLKIVGGRKILIHQGLDGAFYESGQGREEGQAVVIDVTNDARLASNVGAVVKATLIYQDAGQPLLRGMGSWLGQGSAMVKFRVDDSHSVVLGVVFYGRFSVPTKRMIRHGIGQIAFPTDRNLLNCARAAVTVRLTDANTGDLYCEEKFEVVVNPLNISRA